jgi:SSS family solute:Na+ symporter
MLLAFIILYLMGTVAIGWMASRRVKSTADFVVAGRNLPTAMAAAALFATWFGSETVLGAPAVFLEGGLLGVIEDPFGAALCLFLVGLVFARPLYRLNILTFNDFFRLRFGRFTEVASAFFIIPSYFGWIAAQLVALAILLHTLTDLPMGYGIVLCMLVVLFYTYIGGMWAVSITDFVQTIMILIGMVAIAAVLWWRVGGAEPILAGLPDGFFRFFPERDFNAWVHYLAAWITIGLGSIPQQDVFQRVMAAKSERVAVRAAYLSSFMYLTIGAIPLFIGLMGKVLYPDIMKGDPQMVIPRMVLQHGGMALQVLFFGALLSAILSTASGAVLAPATVMGENLIRPLLKKPTDAGMLRIMRLCVVFVAACSAIMAGIKSNIYELVGQASALSLVSLFVPMTAGLYLKRASNTGAVWSIFLGMAAWIAVEFFHPLETPALIVGLLASIAGMVLGSLFFPDDSYQRFQREKAWLQENRDIPFDPHAAEEATKLPPSQPI